MSLGARRRVAYAGTQERNLRGRLANSRNGRRVMGDVTGFSPDEAEELARQPWDAEVRATIHIMHL